MAEANAIDVTRALGDKMFCSKCGTENDITGKFCRNCGMSLSQIKASHKAATIGLQSNIAGLLCYLFGWISGIVLLFLEKEDKSVRFHASQSIVTFGILTVPILVLNLLPPIDGILYWVSLISYWVIVTLSLMLWIFLMDKAYQGQTYRLFVAGDIAQRLFYSGSKATFENVEIDLSMGAGRSPALGTEFLKLEKEFQQGIEDLRESLDETVEAIVSLSEKRDPYTAAHQRQVARLACAIAREIGLSEDRIKGVRVTGAIHDIGKISVPTEILSKPGKLTSEEFNLIKSHPRVAYDVLIKLEFPWPVAQTILQHHERLDGSGYPDGLSGEDIIIEAKILSVADVVEAMSSHRPYRPALGMDKALNEIIQNAGVLYDPKVVDACVRLFTEKGFKLEQEE